MTMNSSGACPGPLLRAGADRGWTGSLGPLLGVAARRDHSRADLPDTGRMKRKLVRVVLFSILLTALSAFCLSSRPPEATKSSEPSLRDILADRVVIRPGSLLQVFVTDQRGSARNRADGSRTALEPRQPVSSSEPRLPIEQHLARADMIPRYWIAAARRRAPPCG